MISETRCQEILEKLLSKAEADQAEAVILARDLSLTRFANSTIHQNVDETDISIYLRVAIGKKLGVIRSNRSEEESLKEMARRVVEIARCQPDNPDFDGFAKSPRANPINVYCEETANCDPLRRAENVKAVIRESDRFGFLAAGSHYTSATAIAYANTLGTTQFHRFTSAYMNTVIMSPTSSGYADFSSISIEDFDAAKIGAKATKICADSQNPRDLNEGKYEVVISSDGMSELMFWLAYIGFAPENFQDGRSFISGRLGEKIMGDNISIWDDGFDPNGLPMPFDFEGVPRKRVDLISKGVAKGVVHSLITAKRGKTESTGHALPPGGEVCALPTNIFFSPGDSSIDDMVKSIKRGLLVTRFHYINGLLDTRKALFTGMTRDGTFYVEDGKVKYPIKNLRFTQSMLEAFSKVEMISKEAKLFVTDVIGGYVLPAVKVSEFNFSGKTEF